MQSWRIGYRDYADYYGRSRSEAEDGWEAFWDDRKADFEGTAEDFEEFEEACWEEWQDRCEREAESSEAAAEAYWEEYRDMLREAEYIDRGGEYFDE